MEVSYGSGKNFSSGLKAVMKNIINLQTRTGNNG